MSINALMTCYEMLYPCMCTLYTILVILHDNPDKEEGEPYTEKEASTRAINCKAVQI